MSATNADAFALLVETMLAADTASPLSRHERTLVMVHADALATEGHLHDGPALSTDKLRRIGCGAPVCVMLRRGLERLDLGRVSRAPTRAQRRALMAREAGCRFPGCDEARHVDAHHIVHWADGGPTDLANLVLLCWRHHHAVHEGGYSMAMANGVLTVWRPDGSLLASESLLLAEGAGIVEQDEALGLGIHADTLAWRWDTRRPSYADAVGGLLWLEDQYRRDMAESRI